MHFWKKKILNSFVGNRELITMSLVLTNFHLTKSQNASRVGFSKIAFLQTNLFQVQMHLYGNKKILNCFLDRKLMVSLG